MDLREPDAISLHIDLDRLKPMTDPWYRHIMVSQGTFIESLALALRCGPNGALGRHAFPTCAQCSRCIAAEP